MQILVVTACVLTVPLAVGGFIVRSQEHSFIYRPTAGPVGSSPGVDVDLKAGDGVMLHAWHLPKPDAPWSVLWLHGSGGNLSNQRALAERLARLPADVLLPDYRGYGQSQGTPSEEGLYRDGQAALDWLAARKGAARVVIVGESLGGAVAAELAVTQHCAGLVLLSTFTSVADQASHMVPYFPARWFVGSGYDTLSKVGSIAAPKLIIHGRRDASVPFSAGERIHEAAAPPKAALWLDRAGHDDVWSTHGDEVLQRLEEFLREPGR